MGRFICWNVSRIFNAWNPCHTKRTPRSSRNPHTLNGITKYPLVPWITVIIGNYRGISDSSPSLLDSLPVFYSPLSSSAVKLRNMRLCYKTNALRFRDGPRQPFLARTCGEMLTVMYRYSLECPLKSIVSGCECILSLRARIYL